mgnify:CR=1 FL=1
MENGIQKLLSKLKSKKIKVKSQPILIGKESVWEHIGNKFKNHNSYIYMSVLSYLILSET